MSNNPDNIRGSVIRVEHYGPWLLTFDVSFLIRSDGRLEDVTVILNGVEAYDEFWRPYEFFTRKIVTRLEVETEFPDQELIDQWAAERERAGARAW